MALSDPIIAAPKCTLKKRQRVGMLIAAFFIGVFMTISGLTAFKAIKKAKQDPDTIIAQLEEENEELVQKISQFKNKLAELTKINNEIKGHNGLKTILENAQQEYEDSRSEYAKLIEEKPTSYARHNAKLQEIETTKKAYEKAMKAYNEAVNKRDSIIKKIEELIDELQRLYKNYTGTDLDLDVEYNIKEVNGTINITITNIASRISELYNQLLELTSINYVPSVELGQ